MTLPNMPLGLHYEPEQNTLKYTPNTGATRTKMDQGPQMARQRFTNAVLIQDFTWLYTAEEFEIFKSFVQFELDNGTKWFNMLTWTGSQYAMAKCQFLQDYEGNASGVDDMRVTAQLQIKGIVTLDEGAGWFVGQYGADFTVWISDKVHEIVNEDMPAALANY